MSELVYEALARTFGHLGLGAVFGLMGEETAKLTVAIAERGETRYYSTRHESAAVSAADGYARATGGLGVCLISRGPGFTNALTGLVAARKAGSPVLALVADTAETDDPAPRRYPKHIEQGDIAAACGLRSVRVRDGAGAVADVVAAARHALAERTVVVVNVPTNVFEQPAGEDAAADLPADGGGVRLRAPAPEDVATIAELLSTAERPLLIAGRGTRGADGRAAVEELAAACGAVIGTSVQAKDAFRGHPSNLGIIGGFSHGLAREAVAEADVVVALGASLNAFTAGGGQYFADAAVCQVALDAGPTGLRRAPRLVVDADAATTARRVTEALAARGHRATTGWDELRGALAGYDVSSDFPDLSTDDRVDPRALMCALNEALPERRTVTVDGGHFCGFPASYLDVPGPEDFAFCLDYSAVGIGFGTALGMAVARPDWTNVLVIGDGGLLMTLTELDTVTREGLPLVVVVVNDAAYGAELHYLELSGMSADEALIAERDFARIASAFDFDVATVRTVEDAREAGRRAHGLARPLLVDCRVNPAVRARWIEELFTPGTYGR